MDGAVSATSCMHGVLARLSHEVWADCRSSGELVHFFFVSVLGIGFSIGQPAWICLTEMREAHDSLLVRDKGSDFGL